MFKKFNRNSIDMLNGSIVDKIFLFALPIAITSTIQQFFNAADIIVCGRFVGSVALAAVGANTQIVNFCINCFTGLAVGANVMIASYIGANKKEKIFNVVHTSMTFAYVFSLVFVVLGFIFSRKMLVFLGTPNDIFELANQYLIIIFFGFPGLVIYNFGAAILRSIGDTRRPLIILTCTGILNVILNIFFVVVMKVGVAGVAYATSISAYVSAIVVVLLMIREKGEIHYNIHKFMLNLDALFKVMKIGVPCAIQGMVFSISNLCVQSAVNSLGTNTIAGNAASVNLEYYPYYFVHACGDSCLTFMSQNLGAKKYDRCKKIFKYCIIISFILGIGMTGIIQIFARGLTGLFSTDVDVINISLVRTRIAGAFVWIQTFYDCGGAGLRAMRHPIIPSIVVILGTVVFRIVWCIYVFPIFNTYGMIAIVYPISWLIIDIIMIIVYLKVSNDIYSGKVVYT